MKRKRLRQGQTHILGAGVTPAAAIERYAKTIVKASLHEDVGAGDLTTEAIVPPGKMARAVIIAKENFVVAGLKIAEIAFKTVDRSVKFKAMVRDGASVKKGGVLASVSGRARAILSAERVALNFLQRMSAIATLTDKFVKSVAASGSAVKILDTRKTTPCLRTLEKYSVRVGGGFNHRFGLFDAILIKDNHIKIAGTVTEAMRRVRLKYPIGGGHHALGGGHHAQGFPVEVEVKNLKEVKEALNGKASVIMLDNMSPTAVKKARRLVGRSALIEVSGGITLKNIKKFAASADFISIGALTHSAAAVDISLEME